MQISGTSPVAMPFCRRASLSSASGVKTDASSYPLRDRIGGRSSLRSCSAVHLRRAFRFLRTSLGHRDGGQRPGGEGERSDGGDRRRRPESIGQDAGGKRAESVAEIAPEAIDAERTRAPGGVGSVRNRGDQRRIDHRGAEAEQHAGDEPPARSSASPRSGTTRPPASTFRRRSGPCGPSGR